jgi:hypothetical protein
MAPLSDPGRGRSSKVPALADDLALRISEAMDALDQANTIFNYVFFALSGFGGVGDPKWDYKFAAMINVSRLIEPIPDTTEDTIIAASREIALRRLPRLLCISLVSSVEICLEDIVRNYSPCSCG